MWASLVKKKNSEDDLGVFVTMVAIRHCYSVGAPHLNVAPHVKESLALYCLKNSNEKLAPRFNFAPEPICQSGVGR